MTKPDDIDQDSWEKAWSIVSDIQMKDIKDGLPAGWEVFASIDRIARAIMSARAEERERWKPATVYFERYCQDEADDVENCVCGLRQHEDAKAFAAAIRNRP